MNVSTSKVSLNQTSSNLNINQTSREHLGGMAHGHATLNISGLASSHAFQGAAQQKQQRLQQTQPLQLSFYGQQAKQGGFGSQAATPVSTGPLSSHSPNNAGNHGAYLNQTQQMLY